jgi:insertion element IS1 protein InsB
MVPPGDVDVIIRRADEAEVDEMWPFVGKKHEQRWLWHAIDHCTGAVLAYVLEHMFFHSPLLLFAEGVLWDHPLSHQLLGAYTRHLDPAEHNPGKRHTQKSSANI